jgi:hypothetical protein
LYTHLVTEAALCVEGMLPACIVAVPPMRLHPLLHPSCSAVHAIICSITRLNPVLLLLRLLLLLLLLPGGRSVRRRNS